MEPHKPADPTELDGIAMRGHLGQGGMGTVYYGVMPDGEQVAVKMIREDRMDRSGVLGRFEREALAIGTVQGPRVANLVRASAPGETPPWFAVEYVRGLTLAEYLTARRRSSPAWAPPSGSASPRRPPAIHQADVLHRDLSPPTSWHGNPSPFLPGVQPAQ